MFMWESSWPADTRHLCTRGDGSGAGSWKFEFRQVSTANTFQPRVGAVTCSSGTGTKNESAWHLVGYTADRHANPQHYLDGSTDGSGTSIAAESATSYDHTGDLYLARRGLADAVDRLREEGVDLHVL